MPEPFYQAPAEVLKESFKTPPAAVNPWVYWYWINDHISKTGIERDLAAMQKANISTALIGIIHLNPENGRYGEIPALSEDWWAHLRFAIEKAAEYNIDIGLFNSPGWSQSGGPWVGLDQSMRYLDSTTYQFSGPNAGKLLLNKPKGFTQNVKVLAFKTPAAESIRLNNKQTSVTVRNGVLHKIHSDNQDPLSLIDQDKESIYTFPTPIFQQTTGEQKQWKKLHFDFNHNQPFLARTLEIYPHDAFTAQATLLAKTSQGEFRPIQSFTLQRPRNKAAIGPDHDAPIVINFPQVKAREFRLTLSSFKLARREGGQTPGIKELILSPGYKLERYVEKALAKVYPNPQPKYDSYLWPKPIPADTPDLAIKADQVLDLTHLLHDDTLNWVAPAGPWTVIHYYMRPTGTTNGPSSKNARGPEIDKLSKPIAKYHFDSYVGKVIESMKPAQRRALKYLVVDSYEQGAQNWTDDFVKKFKSQMGYDPTPFLPVYTGRIVNSAEQSERFLWDVRRFVADNISYEYTAGLRERAHQQGLKLWLENYGHWGFPGEFLQYGGQADIVSGEFWATGNLGAIELKAASSAAHIYGHKTVMSESFTSGRSTSFINHPWEFKKRGDWSFVEGVNHTLLHVYVQQAYDDKFPGVNAWFGSEFNRNNTWFDYIGGWLDYIRRANYMMQQGHYVADIMYFIGEDAPKMTGELNPSVPKGYSYDFINAEVILHRVSVKNGEFHLPNSMAFKLLVLPNLDTMRPELLGKIQQLVAEGGTIFGPKPVASPSLRNYPKADQQILRLANTLWQNIDGQNVTQAHHGLGRVIYVDRENVDLSAVLKQIEREPDLADLPETVIWSHRSSQTHEIYFIANQSESAIEIQPSFRIGQNKDSNYGPPQRWDAITGSTHHVAQFQVNDSRIQIPMTLQGLASTFIVFEKSKTGTKLNNEYAIRNVNLNGKSTLLASVVDDRNRIVLDITQNGDYRVEQYNGRSQKLSVQNLPAPKTVSQPWQLTFENDHDIPKQKVLHQLVPLNELAPLALKYYSGVVRYESEVVLESTAFQDDLHWLLDLGEVGVIARVRINGEHVGELWSRPLQVDVTDTLRIGSNTIEIEVATTWLNRLIGDLKYPVQFPDQPSSKEFETVTTFKTAITENSPLQRTGLIGPVQLKPIMKRKL